MRIIVSSTAMALTQQQFDDWDSSRQQQWIKDHPTSKFGQNPEHQNFNTGSKKPIAKPKSTSQLPMKIRLKVSSMLDKLADMTDKAKAEGSKPPNFDLCDISVPGTNLFCSGNLGIPREKMPQLKGMAMPGSKAEKYGEDGKEVDAEQHFIKDLENKGVDMKKRYIDASLLRSTQSQLVGAKVAKMTEVLKKNPDHPGITAPIFVSKDGYILDGHHRWAAQVGLGLATGKPVKMKTIVVDLNGKQLVNRANKFCDEFGIQQKGA